MTRISWGPRQIAILVTIFTIEALATTSQLMAGALGEGVDLPFWATLKSNLWRAYVWAAFTPLVFAAAGRWRLDRPRWPANLLVMLAVSASFAAAHITLSTFWYYSRLVPRHGSLAGVWTYLASYLPNELVVCVTIVAAYYIVDYALALRDHRVMAAALEARAARLEASTSEARLSALRMELQPHFLFNALHTVAGLVRADERDRAVETITQLGDLLRRSFARDASHETTLRDELAAVREYLAIEQIRFSDRLHVDYVIADDTLEGLVPTLILQPLIENAIRHGVSTSLDARTITIASRRDHGRLIVGIRDNGRGFPPGSTHGVGLSNTTRRLQELYGADGHLTCESPASGGSLVTVTLPWHVEPRRAA